MKIIANIFLTIGVCFASVGAAGFHNPADTGRIEKKSEGNPDTEPKAWPLFGCGMFIIAVGGFLTRSAKSVTVNSQDAQHEHPTATAVTETLNHICISVNSIDDARERLSRSELCHEIDTLLSGYFFDLVDLREDFLQMVGFSDYVKVWDGVATGERLLARVWSIATDGYHEEALKDLPVAREHIQRASDELRKLWPQSS